MSKNLENKISSKFRNFGKGSPFASITFPMLDCENQELPANGSQVLRLFETFKITEPYARETEGALVDLFSAAIEIARKCRKDLSGGPVIYAASAASSRAADGREEYQALIIKHTRDKLDILRGSESLQRLVVALRSS